MMVKLWCDSYEEIDPETVKIIGPDGVDYSDFSNLAEDQLIVRFYKNQALNIIKDPIVGEKYPIVVTDDAASFEFEFTIEIVGKKD